MLQTYADNFAPRVMQAAGPASPVFAFTPKDAVFDTSGARLVSGQVKLFRHWSYIAIDANSTKAAEQLPNVSIMRAAGSTPRRPTQKWRALPVAKRQFLTARYPRIAQAMQYGGVEMEPAPDNHPICDLIRRVNDAGDWWQTFAYETFMFLQLTGRFAWWLIPSALQSEYGPIPAELCVVPPQWLKPVYAKSGELVKYTIQPNGDRRGEFDVSPDEIIEGKKKSPVSKVDAYSALQAGAEWAQNSEFIERARNLLYRHGNMQSMLIEMDPDYHENVTVELVERVREQFLQKLKGGADNVHRPIVSPPGLKVQPLSLKPHDMLTEPAAEQIRDFVLALHRTPKGVLGMTQDYNRANIDGVNLIWCEHTICPMQSFVAGCMTEKLAKRYGDGVVVWYDDCRPADAAEEREEVKLDWQMGALTPDERRQARGYDALDTEASSKTFVPSSVIPLDDAAAPPEPMPATPPDGDGTDPEDAADTSTDTSQSFHACPVHGGAVRMGAREKRIARTFARVHRAHERNATQSIKRMWSRVKQSVLRRVEQYGSEKSVPPADQLLPRGDFRDIFNQTMRPHWGRMVASGVDFEAEMLGVDFTPKNRVKQDADPLPDISVEYSDALKAKMRSYLKSRAAGVWQLVIKPVHEAMQDAIQESLQNGEHIREISKRLADTLDTTRDQAVRIARTEATASLNYGGQALRETEGITQKQWISTIDSKTRPTHAAADSQIVDNDKPFEVGGSLMMHPGDGSLGAPAEEIVACRCTATGYVEL